MTEHARLYSGRILKKNVSQAGSTLTADGQASDSYQDIPTEELREVILAEAQREADELRTKRIGELDREIERAVAGHIMTATRELNLSMAAASGDIARIVETAVRRIFGEKSKGSLLAGIVTQAVKEKNAERTAIITTSSADFPKLELIRLGAKKDDALRWVKIVEDETMAKGRVIMTVNDKHYDISLETQLDAMKTALQLDPETLGAAVSA